MLFGLRTWRSFPSLSLPAWKEPEEGNNECETTRRGRFLPLRRNTHLFTHNPLLPGLPGDSSEEPRREESRLADKGLSEEQGGKVWPELVTRRTNQETREGGGRLAEAAESRSEEENSWAAKIAPLQTSAQPGR